MGKIRNLGVIVSGIMKIHEEESFGHDEIRMMYAPSECGELVSKGASDDIDRLLAKHNLTRKTYNEELEARVSARWIYDNHAGVDEEPYHPPCRSRHCTMQRMYGVG